MASTLREIDIAIDSRLENVSLLGVAVRALGLDLGLDAQAAAHLELCTVEAATNAVRHAYAGSRGRPVRVTVSALADAVQVRVLDEGEPLPEEKREPRAPEVRPDDLESLPASGRGMFLMHTLMDQVRFSREDGCNVVSLVKALPRRAART